MIKFDPKYSLLKKAGWTDCSGDFGNKKDKSFSSPCNIKSGMALLSRILQPSYGHFSRHFQFFPLSVTFFRKLSRVEIPWISIGFPSILNRFWRRWWWISEIMDFPSMGIHGSSTRVLCFKQHSLETGVRNINIVMLSVGYWERSLVSSTVRPGLI